MNVRFYFIARLLRWRLRRSGVAGVVSARYGAQTWRLAEGRLNDSLMFGSECLLLGLVAAFGCVPIRRVAQAGQHIAHARARGVVDTSEAVDHVREVVQERVGLEKEMVREFNGQARVRNPSEPTEEPGAH